MRRLSCSLPWTDWDKEAFREIWSVLITSKQPLPLNMTTDYAPKTGITIDYDEPKTPEDCDYMKGILLRCKEIQIQVGQLQLMGETKA